MLTSDDIDRYFGQTRHWGGCFLQDELPRKIRPGCFYVLNLDRAADHKPTDREIGTHWCAVDNRRPTTVTYFDPFGMPPDDRIVAWMKTARATASHTLGRRKQIIYNTETIQDPDSECCGWLCIYALDTCTSKSFVNMLVNGFDHGFQTWKNDLIAKRMARATYYGVV